MAIRSKANFSGLYIDPSGTYADNLTGDITAADLRAGIQDLVDSTALAWSPDYESNPPSGIKFGDYNGGNYSEFQEDTGFQLAYGSGMAWEDLRVTALSTAELGSNAPQLALFKATAEITTGNSIYQTASSQSAQSVASGAALGLDSDFTMAFWVNADSFAGTQTLLTIGTFFVEWRFSDNIRIGNYGGTSYVGGSVIKGQRNFVVFTFESLGGNNYEANLYINNSLIDTDSFTDGSLPDNSDATLELFGDSFAGRIDALSFYNTTWGTADVNTAYNGGDGSSLTGAESNLIYGWNFDEGTGTTAAEVNGESVGFTGVDDWGSGLVTTESSKGVVVKAFNPDIEQEVYFELQMPHAWKEGTDLRPHVHWVPLISGGAGERVTWGLEYTWANIGSTFSDTTIITNNDNIYSEDLVKDKHYITALPVISGNGKTLSSMLMCRLFRDATSNYKSDTYSGYAGFLEFDLHYMVDSKGSRQEYVK